MPAAVGDDSKVAVLAFGLVGSQSVFESEAKGAAAILAQRLGAGAADVVVRANTKARGDVTIAAISAALQSAAAKMDHDNDLLVLVLTSHGSQDGVAVQAGRRVQILSPPALAAGSRRHARPCRHAAPPGNRFGLLFGRFPHPRQ
jgi:hypothetical protein